MTRRKEGGVRIERDDLWVMLISTVRYSMGRMTYMSNLAPALVMKHRDVLDTSELEQIRDEVKSELDRADGLGNTLGHSWDDASWRGFVWDLTEKIEERKSS